MCTNKNIRILYLDSDGNELGDYFREKREETGLCHNESLYKSVRKNLLFKMIQFMGIFFFPPILYILYGDWKKHLDEYDVVILTSRKSALYALKLLSKKNKRIIVYYWNLVTKREMTPEMCRSLGAETWSFDMADCDKYGMKFADTYGFVEIDEKPKPSRYDLFYLGAERPGRYETLKDIANRISKSGLSYCFYYVTSENMDDNLGFHNRTVKYNEAISIMKECGTILDLNRYGQSGLTLRPVEALLMDKKLITNNYDIKKYAIYDSENICFIDDKNLDLFIKKNIGNSNREKRKQLYRFETWLHRIINHIEAKRYE